MAAAILHDVGRTREFTYGAEFGLSDEGRMLGHLAIGARDGRRGGRRRSRRAAAGAAPLRALPPRPRRRARVARRRSPRRGAGFASPEALALYRLNALDASVKGALEHGLSPAPPDRETARRRTAAGAANESSSARSGTAFEITTPASTPSGERAPTSRPSRDPDVAVAVLAPGADQRHGDDRQQRGRLGADLGLVEEDRQRGHEQDPAADAEQAAERAAGEPEQRCGHVLHQPTSSSTATTTSSSANRSEIARSGSRC